MGLKVKNENAVFCRLHVNEAKKLVITKREKLEGTENYKDGETFDCIDGTLRGVLLSQYEKDDEMLDKLTLRIEDETDNTMYVIGSNFNFPSRALMNKLILAASEDNIKDAAIEINVRTDKEGYHSVFVKFDNREIKQMFPNSVQPKRRAYIGKGNKEQYDDTPLNDFFKNAMELYVLPQFQTVKEKEVETTTEQEAE